MSEKIYTIPVNEVFDECAGDRSLGCPFCRLYKKLQKNEAELILGASMMEPDVRIQTNEKSFCRDHFKLLISGKNRLGLGLILESHMNQLRGEVNDSGISALVGKIGKAAPRRLSKLESSCYICDRIEYNFSRMLSNAVLLWEEEEEFKKKVKAQSYICLPHFREWLEVAESCLKRDYPKFYKEISETVYKYFDELCGDISWFCKKFDYRYDNEPWGNSKDSIERAEKFLCGDINDG